MPRKNKNGRSTHYRPMTFKEMCAKLGVTPKQRVLMIREYNKLTQRVPERK